MNETQFNGISKIHSITEVETILNLDDATKLKRQFSKEENEWKKSKAFLEQKIELLQLEIAEAKQREENLRKMNETILTTLNDISNPSQKSNDKIIIKGFLEKMGEDDYKEKINNENISKLESENKELRNLLSELEKKTNENEINFERRKLDYEIKINQTENANKTLQNLLKKIEEEKKKSNESLSTSNQYKIEEHHKEFESLKERHYKEINSLRENSNKEIKKLKEIYEQEKLKSQNKILIMEKNIKNYQNVLETREYVTIENYNSTIKEITNQKEKEIYELVRINTELSEKLNSLQNMVYKIKSSSDFHLLQAENESQALKITDLKTKIIKAKDVYIAMQRSLLQEKSNKSFNMDVDSAKIDNISSNATPMNRTPLRVQISYDETEKNRQNLISSYFSTSQKQTVSPLNAHHQKNKSSVKDRFKNKETITSDKIKIESEGDDYEDEKSEIIISKNKVNESVLEKKIKEKKLENFSMPLAYDEYLNKKNREKIVKSRGEIMENFENEKSFIEEKLFELEKRLSHNECFNINLQNEKEKLKKDLQKLSLSIKTMNEVEKNDSFQERTSKNTETSAKKEIKVMISKLLKAKEKLSNDQENTNTRSPFIQNSSHKKYNKSLQIYEKQNYDETNQISDFYEKIETRKYNQEKLQKRNKAPNSMNQYEY